jgi:hypothetical protein
MLVRSYLKGVLYEITRYHPAQKRENESNGLTGSQWPVNPSDRKQIPKTPPGRMGVALKMKNIRASVT